MQRITQSSINYLLPLCLLGFLAISISYFNLIFTASTRWIFILILLTYLIGKNGLIRHFDILFFFPFSLYLIWCFLTVFWSDIPLLSLAKGGIYVIVTLSMISAGIEWMKFHSLYKSLDYLKLLTFIILIASFTGMHSADDLFNNSQIYFQGNVGGSNMLGILLAMIFPFLLWNAYLNYHKSKKFIFWLILLISSVMFLLASMSRSSMIVVILITSGFFYSFKMRKKFLIIFTSLLAISLLILFKPDILEQQIIKYIYKQDVSRTLLFASREANWEVSLDAAKKGGLVGLGLGIDTNQKDFNFSWSSVGYAREKGSSQLAIIEETGLIGFVLYLLVLSIFFIKIIKLGYTLDSQNKTLVFIVGGTIFGMIGHSLFEAWWYSPGSPECVYFWTLIGILRGIELRMCTLRNHHLEK